MKPAVLIARTVIRWGLPLLLAGCVAGPRRPPALAEYDLRPPGGQPESTAVGAVDVRSPSWLDTSAMQYRLAYENGARRFAYAESRWVAPPGELLAQALRRSLVNGTGSCRLRVDLDEFLQVFDSQAKSRAVIEARAELLAPRDGSVLSRRAFAVARPTGSADARGGAAAFNAGIAELAVGLGEWLNGLERRPGSDGGIGRRCAGA